MQTPPFLPELDAVIARSLARSAAYGIDPLHDGAPEATRLGSADLHKRIAAQQEFFLFAREQIDSLYRLLKDTGFCMALADGEGYVLYVVGDADLMEHFTRRRCLPGYRWTEKDVGTCAIGLALAERIPVFLPGSRMYSVPARDISNAGAPVFSPDGTQVLGAISLSGQSSRMHIHTLGLVRQAAETVRAQLRERGRFRELAIKRQSLRAIIDADSRGIVTITSEGRIAECNRRARSLLGLPSACEGQLLDVYLEAGELLHCLATGSSLRAKEAVARQSGIIHFVSLDPLRMPGGEVVGGLLTIQERKEVMRMAVEVTGNMAHFTFESILGKSEKLRLAVHHARIAAGGGAPVLLSGETGTGKELFAQAIHNSSKRAHQPFVALNCAAIPKELLESELFGYEEGSFTGAQRGGRPGKLELADSGTLFLDEIGDMPFDMQVKLLRVLQSGEIRRVGGLRTIAVNLRIISATNRDLRQAIADHKFREDLYYRISTLTIDIPPLRERPEDILLLAEHFIRRQAQLLERPVLPLSDLTCRALLSYAWPGNIRQLESRVERAMHLAEGNELLPEHFFGQSAQEENPSGILEGGSLAERELRVIQDMLEACGGNMSLCARRLGISRPTLYRKLRRGRDDRA